MMLYILHCFRQLEDFKIAYIQKLVLDRLSGNYITQRQVLTRQAAVHTEMYQGTRVIFTLKGISANGVGDPVFVFAQNAFNISPVLINNNIVLRYRRNVPMYHVLTFPDWSEANRFRNALIAFTVEDLPVPIPIAIQEVLESITL